MAAKAEAKEEEVKSEVKEEDEKKLEVKAEEGQAPEKSGELESDATPDSRGKVVAGAVGLNMSEATLNVLPTMKDKLLMSFTDGGFQYLIAGVRCTAGLKSGRYMFEAKIVETLNPSEPQGTKTPAPKQLVRVGFSLTGSPVFLSESADYCCFDSEGCFSYGKQRSKVGQKFGFAETVSVLLNLDETSPNANTVSLFKNGVRASAPQALPETLRGKPLFPTVAYKNVTLQVNFGPTPLVPLPFSCRMVKDAAAEDVEIVTPTVPADGKYEVLFPVGMPDEGIFAWADQFLEANPSYTEISDRMIIDWATKSGIVRAKSSKGTLDKPEMNFGLSLLDDLSVRKLLSVVAPTLNRSFLVMELKANLIPQERRESLVRFSNFKKVGVVAMGEPSDDYKDKVYDVLLAEKQAKADEAKKKKAQEDERTRLLEEKKRKAEEAKKAQEKAKEVKKENGEAKDEGEEKPEEENKEEENKEEEDVKMDEPDSVVELTEEEKKVWHLKQAVPDLSQAIVTKHFASFALPDTSEGFDEVRYVWAPAEVCTKTFHEWVYGQKMSQRVEHLEPGEWFKEQWASWQKTIVDIKKKQQDWKDPIKKKALLAKRKEEAKKKRAEDGEEEVEGAEDDMEIHADDLDVFTIEDINDIGSGEPLYANFIYEDWTLLSLRLEFHLLLHAWKKDVDDPERPSFKEKDFGFYYNKYFKKQFNIKLYGVNEKMSELLDLINETATLDETTGFLEAQVEAELPFEEFVKQTEEHRRDRQRRVDAGDETAKIKFQRAAVTPSGPVAAKPGAPGVVAGIKRPYAAVASPSPVGANRPVVARATYAAAPGARVAGSYGAAPRPAYGATPAYRVAPGAPARAAYTAPPGVGRIAPSGAARPAVYGGGLYRRV